MAQVSGSLISRNYSGFRGVDFSNRKDEVSLYHSPDESLSDRDMPDNTPEYPSLHFASDWLQSAE